MTYWPLDSKLNLFLLYPVKERNDDYKILSIDRTWDEKDKEFNDKSLDIIKINLVEQF